MKKLTVIFILILSFFVIINSFNVLILQNELSAEKFKSQEALANLSFELNKHNVKVIKLENVIDFRNSVDKRDLIYAIICFDKFIYNGISHFIVVINGESVFFDLFPRRDSDWTSNSFLIQWNPVETGIELKDFQGVCGKLYSLDSPEEFPK